MMAVLAAPCWPCWPWKLLNSLVCALHNTVGEGMPYLWSPKSYPEGRTAVKKKQLSRLGVRLTVACDH
jgi:hypothetical protein